jgi:four helix bundle protein
LDAGLKEENEILDLTFRFATRIVKLSRYLQQHHKEYVLSKQIFRSGTSIGANVNEAQAAQSRKDFLHKMAVASKEARETFYWLRLLMETEYLDASHVSVQSLNDELHSINKILVSIVKTTSNTR